MTYTFSIQYLDKFDSKFSGKKVLVDGNGSDRTSALDDAVSKFYRTHPDAEIRTPSGIRLSSVRL